MLPALARLYELYLLALDRTGLGPSLARLPYPDAPELRPAWAAVVLATVVLAIYGALASGKDHAVEAFRAFCFVLAATLPVAGVRLVATGYRAPFTGGVLVVLLAAGLCHRALLSRRKDGTAARAIEQLRWLFEVSGLVLFGACAWELVNDREVSVRLAFWALFLLRLSIADLIDPSVLAEETGLRKSAVKDLKAGVRGARLRPSRLGGGILKGLLLAAWLAMPLLSALAQGEVARGEWPRAALALRHYPAFALGVTALVLLARAVTGLRSSPLDSVREAIAGVATGLYLCFAYRDPTFAGYRDALPGLYLVEVAFGFLLGASRGGRR